MRWSSDPLPGPMSGEPADDDPTEVLGSVPGSILARHGARVLKPTEAAGFHGDPVPRSTIYRTRTLLVPGDLPTGHGHRYGLLSPAGELHHGGQRHPVAEVQLVAGAAGAERGTAAGGFQ